MALTATCTLSNTGLLTAGAPTGGVLAVGMTFTNASITEPTAPAAIITSLGSGTGGAGTYNTSLSQTIASSTFTFEQWEPPGSKVPQFTVGGNPVPVLDNLNVKPPAPLPGNPPSSNTTSYST